jgi:hypothetical protein
MTVDIAVSDRRWVTDIDAPGGRKEVIMFCIRNETFLSGILTKYPKAGTTSMAQDITTGAVFTLMGNTSSDWIKMGG